jgi:hypothetical protein
MKHRSANRRVRLWLALARCERTAVSMVRLILRRPAPRPSVAGTGVFLARRAHHRVVRRPCHLWSNRHFLHEA